MLIAVRGVGRPLQLIAVGEKNRCSSCAVISRLNRGYAVRSIDVTTHPRPQTTLNITTNDTEPNG